MTAPFALYLVVVFFEYYGFVRFVPLVNTLSLSLITTMGLFLYTSSKGSMQLWLKEKQTMVLLGLLTLALLSVIHALVQLYALNILKVLMGYFVFFAVSVYFAAHAHQSRILAWFFVMVHVALVIENIEKFFSELRVGFFAGPYFMGDGNDFAWSLNVAFPLAWYLFLSARMVLSRLVSLIAIVLLVGGIVGTGSRGATLALAGGMFYFVVMSDRKVIGGLVAIVGLVGVLLFAPASYFDRMGTIATYSEDTSALGRIEAWGAAINMALDHPLGVGAGNFNSAYGRFYRSDDFFSARWISPHSIYFLTLGEYGVLGLALLLTLLTLNFKQNQRSRARLREMPEPVVSSLWPTCINMSLVAYAVGGVFLGGVTYPHLFILTALTIGVKNIAEGSQSHS